MNLPDARGAADAAMKEKGLTQKDLAALLGSHQTAVSRTLGSNLIDRRSLWPRLLDALGLEIVIQRKGEK
ncbi:helix-turn-helix domain-containing protein [Deinococcus humi]|uniref:HTH-type transcriptional regulator/antitoxin HipB n=1 Tax=Deinococcus humi TaxID=662880 RepID=A0A7W8JQF8_9DEIO|nr:helix-turn-helix domain-containing protein [Deinococcus humi]MBB5361325.1 HTH-type transcriptional regulator/antitoxin HipB [Deinococcus humi]GGO19488.1 hypothetical protein GCM10008949_03900 [Deinococcus humi]